MFAGLMAVTLDAHDVPCLARFWGEMLGREIVADAGGAFLAGADGQVSLRFVPGDTPKAGPNRSRTSGGVRAISTSQVPRAARRCCGTS